MTKQDDLIVYLFDGKIPPGADALSRDLNLWMAESSRFTTFVETYRDKIRKKIHVLRDAESVLDLRSELEVAQRLLTDRRMAVAYEPYASSKRRGPDFAVTYRSNLIFHVEVTRLRGEEHGQAERRIERILLGKLGQMQAGRANLLVTRTEAALGKSIDLGELMQSIKSRVEGKDPTFYAHSDYTNPAGFYKDFLHLSGLLLWWDETETGKGMQYWVNKQARPALDEKVLRLAAQVFRKSDLAGA